MLQVSFIAAFIAGGLSVLPACGPALLPAFFAYAFSRPKRLVFGTAVFAISFAVVFIPFALGVVWLAQLLSLEHVLLTRIVGVVLLLFAIGALMGVSGPYRARSGAPQAGSGIWQAAALGLTFGFTSSSCIAPVLGAIITLSINTESVLDAFALLVWFVLGMFTPLLVAAVCMRWFGQRRIAAVLQQGVEIQLGSRTHRFYWGQLLAAVLFGGLGLLYIANTPTLWLGGLANGRLQDWFFSLNQHLLGY